MKKPWLLIGYIGDYTTQLCGDYNKPLFLDPYEPTTIMESKSFFFFFLRGSC